MNSTDSTLYPLGFVRTQPGYYETPLNKSVIIMTEGDKATVYSTKEDTLTQVETFNLTECPYTNFELVNSL